MRRKSIRVLVVGDQGVGKTSLIYAIMSQIPTEIVKVLKKVILPPDMCLYSKDIFTQIIDTDTETDFKHELQQADIVLLVYDVTQQMSINRLQNHWLPIISNIRLTVPIILVGNKLDKKQLEMQNQHEYTNVRTILKGIVKKYRQTQMGIQCSAYYDRNVKKVLNCAQRAVLYPLGPLYDLNTKQLTIDFQKAIKRIFRILDKDLDGRLSDNELRNLQQRVFQTQLNGDDIKSIKEIIIKQLEQFNQDYIKVNGFLALQKKCIQMLKIQVCWSILRYFDYNDHLQINPTQEEFILNQEIGESLELSSHAINFLQRIYMFCQSQLKQNESPMQKMFCCSPYIPLKQFQDPQITLQKFIMSWHMFTLLDYRECYRSLLYIGYQDTLDMTFKKTRGKKTYSDLQKLKQRKIFTVLIVENGQYQNYLQLLFKKGVKDDKLQRQTFLFSQQAKSKLFLIFKIRQKNIKSFFQSKQNNMKNRIDLVLTFEKEEQMNEKYFEDILQLLPPHTMFRKLTKNEATQALKLEKVPSINLQTFPVQYNDQNWNNFFKCITMTFQKLQLGYSKQKLLQLKGQSDKMNKILTGFAIVGTAALGVLFLKKNPFK